MYYMYIHAHARERDARTRPRDNNHFGEDLELFINKQYYHAVIEIDAYDAC